MSDSHDQSYYEIALTNRQVMSIFVVLLICVLLAFLGGVWLGRDADAAVEMASSQAIVAPTEGGAALAELDFFARRDEAAGGANAMIGNDQPAAKPTPESSKDPGEPKAPPQEKARVTPKEAPKEASKEAIEKPLAEVTRQSVPEPTRQPARQPAAAESPAASVPEAVVVQVFSSNDEAQAKRVADQLRKAGYPAILSPVDVAGRVLHRVRIGPYSDRDEAQVVAGSVSRTFKLETWITH